MDLEEIAKRLGIDFPKNLDLQQSEDLLEYIARELPADVIYGVSYGKSIVHTEEGIETFDRGFKLTGQISSRDNFGKSDSFSILNPDYTSEHFEVGRLEFSMVPGWDINDYRKEVLELWDGVRELVERYFKSLS